MFGTVKEERRLPIVRVYSESRLVVFCSRPVVGDSIDHIPSGVSKVVNRCKHGLSQIVDQRPEAHERLGTVVIVL